MTMTDTVFPLTLETSNATYLLSPLRCLPSAKARKVDDNPGNREAVPANEGEEGMNNTHWAVCNRQLARAINDIHYIHGQSWVVDWKYKGLGYYAKTYDECIKEIVGKDPICIILHSLFASGSEIHEFAAEVLKD